MQNTESYVVVLVTKICLEWWWFPFTQGIDSNHQLKLQPFKCCGLDVGKGPLAANDEILSLDSGYPSLIRPIERFLQSQMQLSKRTLGAAAVITLGNSSWVVLPPYYHHPPPRTKLTSTR